MPDWFWETSGNHLTLHVNAAVRKRLKRHAQMPALHLPRSLWTHMWYCIRNLMQCAHAWVRTGQEGLGLAKNVAKKAHTTELHSRGWSEVSFWMLHSGKLYFCQYPDTQGYLKITEFFRGEIVTTVHATKIRMGDFWLNWPVMAFMNLMIAIDRKSLQNRSDSQSNTARRLWTCKYVEPMGKEEQNGILQLVLPWTCAQKASPLQLSCVGLGCHKTGLGEHTHDTESAWRLGQNESQQWKKNNHDDKIPQAS